MSTASQERSRDSVLKSKAAAPKGGHDPDPGSRAKNAADAPASLRRLIGLLSAEAVDLARVGEEIRAHPALETLVKRLTASLVLSPEGSSPKLEDSAVVLGTHRLRVLIYMWSILQGLAGSDDPLAGNESDSGGQPVTFDAPQTWNPEAFYLASFLRCLGLDSPGALTPRSVPSCFAPSLQSEEFAELRNLLMRDFVSLIPILNPALLKPR
ncbi:MAG TPA: hypothetical protein VN822_02425 [Candidatus Acidoferrales bacterium]|nr:hypothetical protein [Candidatus Acidoferrales bacterium]